MREHIYDINMNKIPRKNNTAFSYFKKNESSKYRRTKVTKQLSSDKATTKY